MSFCFLLTVSCCFSGEGSSSVSPLTPGDLLIALHNIDSTKCDMKSIIKGLRSATEPFRVKLLYKSGVCGPVNM